jgi:uncharacterized protein
MEPNQRNSYLPDNLLTETSVQHKFLNKVFMWMFVALLLSSASAYYFSHTAFLSSYLVNDNGITGLGKLFRFLPLIFVLTMSFGYNKMSSGLLSFLFVAYSIATGISLSFIFAYYTSSSITICFVTASAMFGIMAVMGYYTKANLTSFGQLLRMALIGLIIATLLNLFFQSSQFDYILSFISVAIFTGLTAYDMQKLKNIATGVDTNGDAIAITEVNKMAVYGALQLYLDFINIFLSLLRLMGNRK